MTRQTIRTWLAEHPRLVIALKTAVAAGLAWAVVSQLGGWAADYPYYAPLGAVVTVTNTVARSAREAMGALGAILMGVSLALGAQLAELPVLLSLAVVVGIGTLLGGLPWLGSMGSWVPVAALFVLLVGRNDPMHYSAAYLGLTALGAAVGVAVNLAMPPLPLARAGRAEQRLRSLLAGQLELLADGLLCDDVLSRDEWARRRHDLAPGIRQLEEVMSELRDARRANWRLSQWRETADHQHDQARALHQLSLLVEDVTSLVTHRGHLLREGSRDQESSLLPPAGRALQAMADLLRSLNGPTAPPEQLRATDAAVQDLARAIRENDAGSRRDGFAAAAIVTSIRRAVAALTPEELEDELPSHW